jgi:type VI secretion system secreted protein VgrG
MGIGDQFEPALRSDARIAQVEGDDARLQPAKPFDLIDHPRDDLNIHWPTMNDHRKNARETCAAVSS